MAEKRQRVLSIQSHVVSGYVGNKSATFPLQVLGFEVDAINSVQFSNHTGYGYWKGQVLDERELEGLMDGLHRNGLDYYTHLLTGYIGSAGFLKYIAHVVKQLREVNPDLVYVCDPVMGDNGKMYVPEELLEIYKNTILPLADIITPNQFEAELLTGKQIKSVDDAWQAVEHFHKKGCHTVVLSSTDLGNDENLLALASSRTGNQKTELTIHIPKLPGIFTGTGDLFAALLLAWMWHTNNQLKPSLEKVIATIQAVLKRTSHYATERRKSTNRGFALMELQLIPSKADIENPETIIEAEVR